MKYKEYDVDLCVVGGGMSGLVAAISAARHGASVVLMQDRPVLGGNASGEIRMWICGAHGRDNRETGILEEIVLENFYQNPALKFPLWDGVLHQFAKAEKNLTLLLNTSCLHAETAGARILSVTGWQTNAETYHTVRARYFADCSGDSILSPLTGASARMGRESKAEYGETIPPDVADKKTMGMSCLFQIRECDHPVPYVAPPSAYVYLTDADLPFKDHELTNNFWWIELGGEGDALHDVDECRDELLRICYGVWDHIKNRGDHGADNWEMEWIGFLPGKRESRRYVGLTTVTQRDVEAGGNYPDVVAYAGWSMDDHFPEGFRYRDGHPTIYHPAPSPWGIPFRALVSKDMENLLFAGRNISVTHAALSSCRVMGTCALLGQAVGTAVAQMVKDGTTPTTLDIPLLQETLMEDDCMLPGLHRKVSAVGEYSHPLLGNGRDRGEENVTEVPLCTPLTLTLPAPTPICGVRLVFDSDLNRKGQNMPCRWPLSGPEIGLPPTLLRAFDLIVTDGDGEEHILSVEDNRKRLCRVGFVGEAVEITLIPRATHGAPLARVFSLEIME